MISPKERLRHAQRDLADVDNDSLIIDVMTLGARAIEAGTSGTIYIDDFESRRLSYVGMLPDPGILPGSDSTALSYDANGNMTCRVEVLTAGTTTWLYVYNDENRLWCRKICDDIQLAKEIR